MRAGLPHFPMGVAPKQMELLFVCQMQYRKVAPHQFPPKPTTTHKQSRYFSRCYKDSKKLARRRGDTKEYIIKAVNIFLAKFPPKTKSVVAFKLSNLPVILNGCRVKVLE